MSENQDLPGDNLFFDAALRRYTDGNPRFVRRDWLAVEVEQKLDVATCRFLLLTAEPGAGKSTFAAQLARDNPDWPRYFLRRDQRTPLGNVGARSFLLRVGYQLAARFPELYSQEQIQLSVEQRMGTVAVSGEAVGAIVQRLVASPFVQNLPRIRIQQQADNVAGRLVGLVLEELVVEPRQLSTSDLLYLALLDPARAMARLHPGQRIVVVIDALDEVRYQSETENVLAWLTNCPELPDNVRFVLTSRPHDVTLQAFCQKQASYLQSAAIRDQDPHVQAEVRTYLDRLVDSPRVAAALSAAGTDASGFSVRAAVKAGGNLGYADALARGLDDAIARQDGTTLQGLFALAELPDELKGLYAFFMHQIEADVLSKGLAVQAKAPGSPIPLFLPAWPGAYHPILGVLAVALEPLDVSQICELGGIAAERSFVSDALGRLVQFLDSVDGRYRLYHATLPEFLTADATQADPSTRDLWIDSVDLQKRIVGYYLGTAGEWSTKDWSQVDGYGLRHLVAHLYQLRDVPGYRDKLHALVQTRTFLDQRLRGLATPNPVLDDLRLVLDLALEEDNLARTWQHVVEHRRIALGQLNFTAVEEATLQGQYDAALEWTVLYATMPNSQAMVRLWIAWNMAAAGQSQPAVEVARQALAELQGRNPSHGTYAGHPIDATLIRLVVRSAWCAGPEPQRREDWLHRAVSKWSPGADQAAMPFLSQPLDSWGEIFDAAGMHTNPSDFIKQMTEEITYVGERFYEFQKQFAAALFNTRADPEWSKHVENSVALLSLDDYPSYREMALAWTAAAVLAQDDELTARHALAVVLRGLFKPAPGFWGDSLMAAYDGMVRESIQAPDEGYLLELSRIAEASRAHRIDPTVPTKPPDVVEWRKKVGLPADPWAFDMRRLSAVAAVLYRRGDRDKALARLNEACAQEHTASYAGFRTQARLSLACRWLEWDQVPEAEAQILAAGDDASHMLDPELRDERLALVRRMKEWVQSYAAQQRPPPEDEALAQLSTKAGMERGLYLEFLSAVWHQDTARLKRLLPLALDDAITADAVLGRLLGAEAGQALPGRPFLELMRTMDVGGGVSL